MCCALERRPFRCKVDPNCARLNVVFAFIISHNQGRWWAREVSEWSWVKKNNNNETNCRHRSGKRKCLKRCVHFAIKAGHLETLQIPPRVSEGRICQTCENLPFVNGRKLLENVVNLPKSLFFSACENSDFVKCTCKQKKKRKIFIKCSVHRRPGSMALGELNNERMDDVNDKTWLAAGTGKQRTAMERLQFRVEIVFVTKGCQQKRPANKCCQTNKYGNQQRAPKTQGAEQR